MKFYRNEDTGRSIFFDRSMFLWKLVEADKEPDYALSSSAAVDWMNKQINLDLGDEMKPFRKNLMNRKQVAKHLGIGTRTFDRWRKSGTFDVQPITLNSRVLFWRKEDLADWEKRVS